jgi:hypothetical protein
MIKAESEKFRKIVPQNFTAVLLVCATKYSPDVVALFPHDQMSHLYFQDDIEVIILRLDSCEFRRRFFEKVSTEDKFLSIIERVIAKDIQRKQQREHSSPLTVKRLRIETNANATSE